jgi:spermidine synthase
VQKYILDITVFVCGAVVMIYELIGSRIVSPFIGTSTYVWTSLIGVILGALSLGYWLGGRLADRKPDAKVLAFVIFIAGGLVSMTMLLKEVILAFVAASPVGLEIKSVIAAVFLFAPASVALGMVTPYAIRLRMESVGDSGKTVGSLYALSTIGSIVGTFAAGFFLIPFVGSVRTLYIIAGSLFVLSFVLAPLALSRMNIGIITIFVLGVTGSELNTFYLREKFAMYDKDTEYNRVQVFQTVDPKTGRKLQAMSIDPYFMQSAMFLDTGETPFAYAPFYHLIRHYRPDFKRTLLVGGAGYTLPKEFLHTYPAAEMDVVEIDPAMTEIAREYFRLQDDPRLTIHHEDGRVFLNNAQSAKYDAVLMDAFTSLFSVPHQLTTIEAVRQIDRVLTDNGVVIFNVGSAITGRGSYFLQAELATYREVFPQVQVFKVNSDYTDERLQNVIIVASKSRRSTTFESNDPQLAGLLSHRYLNEIATMPILTDDLAPVEYYSSVAQSALR